MQTYRVLIEPRHGATLVRITGYLGEEGAAELKELLLGVLRGGCSRVAIDFSACGPVSSPGAAVLLEIAVEVIENFRERLALSGLDALKERLFDVAGLLDLVSVTGTAEAAVALVSGKGRR